MWSTYLIYGLCCAALLAWAFWQTKPSVVYERLSEHKLLRDYYVGYQCVHPNQPDATDSGIWTIAAADPDDACGRFLERCGLHRPKITCCTTDYGWACACLLKPERE